MKKCKVCVYAITKNEEKFVDRWVESMKEADEIIVTDTGSTDKTVETLKERGAIVFEETIKPWRFDVARNISLEHVPEDADICVCTDLDEVFEAGWRDRLEAVWTKDVNGGDYIYNWSLKEDESPDVQFVYFKVHSRNNYRWVYPIHECLQYKGDMPEKRVFIPGMVLNHYPDASKARSSYLPLLEMAVEEEPYDARMNYYLGREYLYAGKWRKCIQQLEQYLKLPSASWDEERCAAMRWIASSYEELGEIKQAYQWFYRAIGEHISGRDAYIEFAKLAYKQSDWATLYFLTKEALKIKDKSKTFINMGYSWDETPDDLASIACYHLGLYQEAELHAKKAVKCSPADERLNRNLELIQDMLK